MDKLQQAIKILSDLQIVETEEVLTLLRKYEAEQLARCYNTGKPKELREEIENYDWENGASMEPILTLLSEHEREYEELKQENERLRAISAALKEKILKELRNSYDDLTCDNMEPVVDRIVNLVLQLRD